MAGRADDDDDGMFMYKRFYEDREREQTVTGQYRPAKVVIAGDSRR